MKKIILFLLVLLVVAGCTGDRVKNIHRAKMNDRQKNNLRSEVRSVREVRYKPDKCFAVGESYSLYNESGYLLEWQDKDETQMERQVYKYDNKGNMVELIFGDDLKKKAEYKYDSKGRVIEKTGIDNKSYYKYDDNGNVCEISEYAIDGRPRNKQTTIYGKKGDSAETSSFLPDGTLNQKEVLKYDDEGNTIEKSYYAPGKLLLSKTGFKYDDKKNMTEVLIYKLDGGIDKRITFEYEYDSNGNWIQQKEFLDKIPACTKVRTYEYYK